MIPDGWMRTTIGSHVDVLTGFAFRSEDYTSEAGHIKLLRGDNVAQHKLRWRNVKRLPPTRETGLERFKLQAGDFVVALDRTWIPAGLKLAEVRPEDLPCLLVQRVARLRARSSLQQNLLRQYFSGEDFVNYVRSVQTETAVPHISPNDLREYPITLPPIVEQRRIAEILSTWDRGIETVEALIANARAQKVALTQQLLTGKRRLTHQGATWGMVALVERGTFKKGKGISRSEVKDAGIPCVRYGEIYTQHHDVVQSFGSFIDSTSAAQSERITYGDILFACSGETAEEIGKCVAYMRDHEAYAGGDIVIFSPEGDSPVFLAYLLNSPPLVMQKSQMGQGNAVVHISSSNLAKLRFAIPEREEQDAIARRLLDSDAQIDAYEIQLTALRQEKAALMQQLLTGKRRVRPPAEAA